MMALLLMCACGQGEPPAAKGAELPPLVFDQLKVGQVGVIVAPGGGRKRYVETRVLQVLGPDSVICRAVSWRPRAVVNGPQVTVRAARAHTTRVVLKGVATDNLVDGKLVALPGAWKVARTRRLPTVDGAAATLFELEPAEPEKPKRR